MFYLFHWKKPIASSSFLKVVSCTSDGGLNGDLGGPRSCPMIDIKAFRAATLLPSKSPKRVHTSIMSRRSAIVNGDDNIL